MAFKSQNGKCLGQTVVDGQSRAIILQKIAVVFHITGTSATAAARSCVACACTSLGPKAVSSTARARARGAGAHFWSTIIGVDTFRLQPVKV